MYHETAGRVELGVQVLGMNHARCKSWPGPWQCADRLRDCITIKLMILALFAGHPQPLRGWVLCRYCMGLNLAHRQIAPEGGLSPGDVQQMTEQ